MTWKPSPHEERQCTAKNGLSALICNDGRCPTCECMARQLLSTEEAVVSERQSRFAGYAHK